ncbi:MAG: isochorismatase family protein [Chloroflexota bacterium]
MSIWDDVIGEQDRLVYRESGYGEGKIGLGQKPALIVVDVTYNFMGDKPEPVLESIKRFPYSCGEVGWVGVRHIASLLPLARQKKVPVIYSVPSPDPKPPGWLFIKSARAGEVAKAPLKYNEIVAEIAPAKQDTVIYKTRPSVFFGTPLLAFLQGLGVDTLLVCGCVTSGCVRATVVDGFSYNFRVGLIEECTFDRGDLSHKVNLFDMNAKYADVISLAQTKDYLSLIQAY